MRLTKLVGYGLLAALIISELAVLGFVLELIAEALLLFGLCLGGIILLGAFGYQAAKERLASS
jgi:hypothetical protein